MDNIAFRSHAADVHLRDRCPAERRRVKKRSLREREREVSRLLINKRARKPTDQLPSQHRPTATRFNSLARRRRREKKKIPAIALRATAIPLHGWIGLSKMRREMDSGSG